MKKHLNLALFASAALLALGISNSRAQNVIGLNFSGRQWSSGGNTPESLNASDTAGVVSQQNWNNVNPAGHDSGTQAQITGPNVGAISDNTATATALTLNYAAQGMWSDCNSSPAPVTVNPKTAGPRMFYRVQGQ
jgi:hypothetical protein